MPLLQMVFFVSLLLKPFTVPVHSRLLFFNAWYFDYDWQFSFCFSFSLCFCFLAIYHTSFHYSFHLMYPGSFKFKDHPLNIQEISMFSYWSREGSRFTALCQSFFPRFFSPCNRHECNLVTCSGGPLAWWMVTTAPLFLRSLTAWNHDQVYKKKEKSKCSVSCHTLHQV